MKYLAHTEPSLDSPIISIYDVINGIKKTPKLFEKQQYYSLWYLTPMTSKIGNSKAPHFAFKQGFNSEQFEKGSGESIEHSIAKYVIYEQKTLLLKHNYTSTDDTKGIIKFKDVRVEYRFDNGDYIADIYAQIENDSILGLDNNAWLAIEIFKTNNSSKYKMSFYRSKNIAAIEIKYFDKIKFENNKDLLQKQIQGWLTKTYLYFKWLHNPNYKQVYKNESNTPHSYIHHKTVVPVCETLQEPQILCTKSMPIEINYEIKTTQKQMNIESVGSDIHPKAMKCKSIWNKLLSFLRLKQ